MAARIKLNSAGIVELLKSPGVEADLLRRARIVEGHAKQTAPVATGAYRDSITTWSVQHRDRVVVRVGSTDRKSAIVEANTGTMVRALGAAGVGDRSA